MLEWISVQDQPIPARENVLAVKMNKNGTANSAKVVWLVPGETYGGRPGVLMCWQGKAWPTHWARFNLPGKNG